MGGGGSNSSPPVDVAPGGGTYPVDASGNAYNPAWGNQGFDWGVLGKGFQTAGSQYAAGASRGLNFPGMPGFQQQPMSGLDVSNQGVSIQPPNKSDADIQAFIDALKRLSSQGKSGGSYYYVNPSAKPYDPMADTNSNNAQLQAWGTQPGF